MLDTKIITLLRVIDEGSYTAAAKKLALTQPGDKVALEYMDDPSGICSASSFDNLGFHQSGQ